MKRKKIVLLIAFLVVCVCGLTIMGKSAFAKEKKKEAPAKEKKVVKTGIAKRVDKSFAEVREKIKEAELDLDEGILGVVKNVKFNLSKQGDPRLEAIYKKEINELIEEQKRIRKESSGLTLTKTSSTVRFPPKACHPNSG